MLDRNAGNRERWAHDRAKEKSLPAAVREELARMCAAGDRNYTIVQRLVLGKALPEADILAEDASSDIEINYGTIEDPQPHTLFDKLGQEQESPATEQERTGDPLAVDLLYVAIDQISQPPTDPMSREKIHTQYLPVLSARFGLPEHPGGGARDVLTLKETGILLELSRERVRQIESQGIWGLRKILLTPEEYEQRGHYANRMREKRYQDTTHHHDGTHQSGVGEQVSQSPIGIAQVIAQTAQPQTEPRGAETQHQLDAPQPSLLARVLEYIPAPLKGLFRK